MSFEVKFTGCPAEWRKDPGDWYEFLPHGVLALHFGNEAKPSEYYSPTGWEYVCSKQPPGRPKADIPEAD